MSDLQLTPEEVALIQEHRARNARPDFQPRTVDSFTPEEKGAAFDRIHKLALDTYRDIERDGYRDEDVKNWFYEAGMGLLGEDVWEAVNQLVR